MDIVPNGHGHSLSTNNKWIWANGRGLTQFTALSVDICVYEYVFKRIQSRIWLRMVTNCPASPLIITKISTYTYISTHFCYYWIALHLSRSCSASYHSDPTYSRWSLCIQILNNLCDRDFQASWNTQVASQDKALSLYQFTSTSYWLRKQRFCWYNLGKCWFRVTWSITIYKFTQLF